MNSDMSSLMSASSESNMYSARARASSVLPMPVAPRKMKEPIGRGVLEAGTGAPHRLRDGDDRIVLANQALVQLLFYPEQP